MKYYIIIILSLLSAVSVAQRPHLFAADTDLSSSLVNAIFIDSDNMVWAATEYGLNRYDGNVFHSYYHEEGNPNSICNNFVQKVFEDSHHNLFVASKRNVQLYDHRTDVFSRPATYADGTIMDAHVADMIELPDGRIVTCGDIMVSLEVRGDSIIASQLEYPSELNNGGGLMCDRNGDFWVHIYHGPLYKYNFTTKVLKKYDTRGVWCVSMCRDYNGIAYFITSTGMIFRYDEARDTLVYLNSLNSVLVSVSSVCSTKDGRLLIGTDGNGLKSYNPKTNTISDETLEGISLNYKKLKVHTLVEDSKSTLWLGIFQSGVVMYPQNRTKFHYIGHKSHQYNLIGSNAITALERDSQGCYWVGTDNDGLYRLSSDRSQSSHFEGDDVPAVFKSLYRDSFGKLWYGTYSQGFGWVDTNTGECHENTDFTDLPLLSVYDFIEDSKGRLWIATLGNGLLCYDLKKGCRLQGIIPDNVINRWINKLYIKDNTLWIGNYDGLTALDLDDTQKIKQSLLHGQVVYDLSSGPENTLWVGTSVGLIALDIENTQIKKIAMNKGASRERQGSSKGAENAIIYSIAREKNDHLWMGTNRGLLHFDPVESVFTAYNVSDGIQEGEFSNNTTLIEGKNLWFGGMGGITYFNPDEIHRDTAQWTISLSQFLLNGSPKHYGDVSGEYEIMSDAVFRSSEFHLSESDNTFSLVFASRDMDIYASHITYSYKLNDEEFVELPNYSNVLSFNNLDPEEYKLTVVGAYEGVCSTPLELTIIVEEETSYARLIIEIIAGILGALAGFFGVTAVKKNKKAAEPEPEQTPVETSDAEPEPNITVEEPQETVSQPENNTILNAQDEKLMERIMVVVNRHLEDTNISIADLSDEIGISTVHLNRKLKELTGDTTSRFIRNYRLEVAAKLLLSQKELSIAEVAAKVGFPDASYFSTTFKEKYGVTPKDYGK